MPKPDVNLHSFNGPEQNGKLVDWSDYNASPGREIADTLKFSSRLKDFGGRFGHVIGGYEDCVDVNNHCERITLHADVWEPRGKYLATVKGGSKDVYISGTVIGHGNEVDVDIGNLSDQSDNPTGPVTLNLRHVNGDEITVRVINGRKPILLNSREQRYKVVLKVPTFWGSLFAKVVHQLRKVGLA